jgi:hypothetical protein
MFAPENKTHASIERDPERRRGYFEALLMGAGAVSLGLESNYYAYDSSRMARRR